VILVFLPVSLFLVYWAMLQQNRVWELKMLPGGIGLAFIIIPMAVNLMPASKLVGVLFFTALTVAGFTSVISLVEVPCCTIMERFNWSRKKAATVFCLIGFFVGVIYSGQSGIFALDIVDYFMNNFGIIFCGIAELIFICWIFKLKSFKEYINRKSDFTVGKLWSFFLILLVPLFLTYIAIGNFILNLSKNYEGYSTLAVLIFGWGIFILIIVLSIVIPRLEKKKKGE
jgi:neurotransmitter:Na+ symporter, NSS family